MPSEGVTSAPDAVMGMDTMGNLPRTKSGVTTVEGGVKRLACCAKGAPSANTKAAALAESQTLPPPKQINASAWWAWASRTMLSTVSTEECAGMSITCAQWTLANKPRTFSNNAVWAMRVLHSNIGRCDCSLRNSSGKSNTASVLQITRVRKDRWLKAFCEFIRKQCRGGGQRLRPTLIQTRPVAKV